MSETTKKEIRVAVSGDDFEFYQNKFKVYCAAIGQSESDTITSLMRFAVGQNKKVAENTFVTQTELMDYLRDNYEIVINRQLLYDHRQRNQLDGLFFESQPEDNRRIFFDLNGCADFYQKLYKTEGEHENANSDEQKQNTENNAAASRAE